MSGRKPTTFISNKTSTDKCLQASSPTQAPFIGRKREGYEQNPTVDEPTDLPVGIQLPAPLGAQQYPAKDTPRLGTDLISREGSLQISREGRRQKEILTGTGLAK